MNDDDELTSFNKTFKIYTQMEKIQKQKDKMIDPSEIFKEVKTPKGKSYRKSQVDKKDNRKDKVFKDFL